MRRSSNSTPPSALVGGDTRCAHVSGPLPPPRGATRKLRAGSFAQNPLNLARFARLGQPHAASPPRWLYELELEARRTAARRADVWGCRWLYLGLCLTPSAHDTACANLWAGPGGLFHSTAARFSSPSFDRVYCAILAALLRHMPSFWRWRDERARQYPAQIGASPTGVPSAHIWTEPTR